MLLLHHSTTTTTTIKMFCVVSSLRYESFLPLTLSSSSSFSSCQLDDNYCHSLHFPPIFLYQQHVLLESKEQHHLDVMYIWKKRDCSSLLLKKRFHAHYANKVESVLSWSFHRCGGLPPSSVSSSIYSLFSSASFFNLFSLFLLFWPLPKSSIHLFIMFLLFWHPPLPPSSSTFFL